MSKYLVSKYRRSTTFSIKFPTVPSIKVKPNSIDIIQKMGSHDVLTIEYLTSSEKVFKVLKTGVPVVASWKQGTQSRTIHAYVSHVEKTTTSQRRVLFKIRCIGASYPLKERSNKVFKNKTITEAVSWIARKHGLKFVGESHPRRFAQLTISGHSYWEWIQEQAARIGYGAMMDGVTLVFRPLDKLLDQSISNSAVLSSFNNQLPSGTLFLDKTLDHFEVLNGENIEANRVLRTNKSVAGVNPLTNRAFSSKQNPKVLGKNLRAKVGDVLFEEHMSSQVVNDMASSKHTAVASAALARLNIPAKARAQGDPRLKPFSPVYIDGTGIETDGYWIINSVKHHINGKGVYTADLTLSTDGTGPNSKKRPAPRSSKGLVDIAAALENKTITTNNSTVKLISKAEVYIESSQGFNRTPSLWKANNEGPRRVC
jgi:phage protein D